MLLADISSYTLHKVVFNMGSTEQHYSLRWNDYTVKIVTAFQSLRDEEDFVDVTVACDGHQYSAHKMVLSACSPYFRSLLRVSIFYSIK